MGRRENSRLGHGRFRAALTTADSQQQQLLSSLVISMAEIAVEFSP